jgi:hypothetical protein
MQIEHRLVPGVRAWIPGPFPIGAAGPGRCSCCSLVQSIRPGKSSQASKAMERWKLRPCDVKSIRRLSGALDTNRFSGWTWNLPKFFMTTRRQTIAIGLALAGASFINRNRHRLFAGSKAEFSERAVRYLP